MTMTSLADWVHSPEILIGQSDHQRLTIAALTDVEHTADQVDFLLYELDRAKIIEDSMLPPDVVRLGSIVRYQPISGEERTVKLVLPEAVEQADSYHLPVTSTQGAAILGLRPGNVISWLDPDGTIQRLTVLNVASPRG